MNWICHFQFEPVSHLVKKEEIAHEEILNGATGGNCWSSLLLGNNFRKALFNCATLILDEF